MWRRNDPLRRAVRGMRAQASSTGCEAVLEAVWHKQATVPLLANGCSWARRFAVAGVVVLLFGAWRVGALLWGPVGGVYEMPPLQSYDELYRFGASRRAVEVLEQIERAMQAVERVHVVRSQSDPLEPRFEPTLQQVWFEDPIVVRRLGEYRPQRYDAGAWRQRPDAERLGYSTLMLPWDEPLLHRLSSMHRFNRVVRVSVTDVELVPGRSAVQVTVACLGRRVQPNALTILADSDSGRPIRLQTFGTVEGKVRAQLDQRYEYPDDIPDELLRDAEDELASRFHPLPTALSKPIHVEQHGSSVVAILGAVAYQRPRERAPLVLIAVASTALGGPSFFCIQRDDGEIYTCHEYGQDAYCTLPPDLAEQFGATRVRVSCLRLSTRARATGATYPIVGYLRAYGDPLHQPAELTLQARGVGLALPIVTQEPEWVGQIFEWE